MNKTVPERFPVGSTVRHRSSRTTHKVRAHGLGDSAYYLYLTDTAAGEGEHPDLYELVSAPTTFRVVDSGGNEQALKRTLEEAKAFVNKHAPDLCGTRIEEIETRVVRTYTSEVTWKENT